MVETDRNRNRNNPFVLHIDFNFMKWILLFFALESTMIYQTFLIFRSVGGQISLMGRSYTP